MQPSTFIGQYQVLKEIGSGGFGTVYLALNPLTHEAVAVKVLRADYAARPELRQRFEQEAEMLRGLPPCDQIVALLDYGETQSQPFLVMPYLAGHDLRDAFEVDHLSGQQMLEIIIQTAIALRVAAASGLVHCDIKPENLRILPNGAVDGDGFWHCAFS